MKLEAVMTPRQRMRAFYAGQAADRIPNGLGGCETAGMHLLYRKGGKWAPVSRASAYGVAADKYNRVTFDKVTTTALGIEADLREGLSAGVLEWRVK